MQRHHQMYLYPMHAKTHAIVRCYGKRPIIRQKYTLFVHELQVQFNCNYRIKLQTLEYAVSVAYNDLRIVSKCVQNHNTYNLCRCYHHGCAGKYKEMIECVEPLLNQIRWYVITDTFAIRNALSHSLVWHLRDGSFCSHLSVPGSEDRSKNEHLYFVSIFPCPISI
eukprot:13326_1